MYFRDAARPGYVAFYTLIAAIAVGFAVLIAATPLLAPAATQFWLHEGGVIETLSAAGYLICIAVIVALGGGRFAWRYANLIILLLFLASRELDFDKRFTTMGIFKSLFYVSPEVPWYEKLAGLAVIVVLTWAVLTFAWRHLRQCVRAFFQLHPAALSAALGIGCILLAKTFDGIARKLVPLGVDMSVEMSKFLTDAEELLELEISVFFIVAAVAYFRTANRHFDAT